MNGLSHNVTLNNKMDPRTVYEIMKNSSWKELDASGRQKLIYSLLDYNEKWAEQFVLEHSTDVIEVVTNDVLDSIQLNVFLERFLFQFGSLNHLKISDIGCGMSASSMYLKIKTNAEILAVEPAQAFHDVYLSKIDVTAIRNSMHNMENISDECCHGVVLKDSLHRMPWFRGDSSAGLEKALKEVNRILVQGGIGYLSMKSRIDSECSVFYKECDGFKQAVTADEMEDLLLKFGMGAISIKTEAYDNNIYWLDVIFEKF